MCHFKISIFLNRVGLACVYFLTVLLWITIKNSRKFFLITKDWKILSELIQKDGVLSKMLILDLNLHLLGSQLLSKNHSLFLWVCFLTIILIKLFIVLLKVQIPIKCMNIVIKNYYIPFIAKIYSCLICITIVLPICF